MKSDFEDEYRRLLKSKKRSPVWGDKGLSAYCVSAIAYLLMVFAIGGIESLEEFLRLLAVLATFGITYGCVYEGFFRK